MSGPYIFLKFFSISLAEYTLKYSLLFSVLVYFTYVAASNIMSALLICDTFIFLYDHVDLIPALLTEASVG